MRRPFRILIVDDEIEKHLMVGPDRLGTIRAAPRSDALWVLRELIETAQGSETRLVIYLARDLLFIEDSVTEITDTGEQWNEDFLWNMDGLDVLVLDFGGVSLDPKWSLKKGDRYIEEATDEQIKELNADYEGAAFYLKNHDRLVNCQAIMFFTQYDKLTGAEVINKFIQPFCDDDSIPQTLMFNPTSIEGIGELADKLKSFFLAFAEGYTQLESLAAIDFAATHDMPVLIVGETGTGKEYIARQIHRRWKQRKDNNLIPEEPTIVNCAALSEELARDELFGHVRGAFSGADDHKLGAILSACGCTDFQANIRRIRSSSNVNDFERGFEEANEWRVQATPQGLEFINNEPSGTLFLDEFGDLPPPVQTLLLRYLQAQEVQPLGYPRVIKDANVRIVVATSDPRVAKFVGVQLYGGWRSKAEMKRPLREDLIFRVKGQVVRAERITAANVEKAFRHFVNQSGEAHRWKPDAYNYLLPRLQAQLEAIEKAVMQGRAISGELPAFGHRRELDRIVKLANAYVASAAGRGLRNNQDAVTARVVERVWKPSVVLSYETAPATAALQSSRTELEDEDLLASEELLTLIENFFAGRTPTLPSGWRRKRAKDRGIDFHDVIKQMAASDQSDERKQLRMLITKKVNGSRGKGDTLYTNVFGATGTAVSQWFLRAKPKST